MAKYTMQRHAADLSLGKSSPRSCLNQSGYIMATLLRPGDRFIVPGGGGACLAIEDALRDEDGEITFVMEDGSYVEIQPTSAAESGG